jgi:hypothetical protein
LQPVYKLVSTEALLCDDGGVALDEEDLDVTAAERVFALLGRGELGHLEDVGVRLLIGGQTGFELTSRFYDLLVAFSHGSDLESGGVSAQGLRDEDDPEEYRHGEDRGNDEALATPALS